MSYYLWTRCFQVNVTVNIGQAPGVASGNCFWFWVDITEWRRPEMSNSHRPFLWLFCFFPFSLPRCLGLLKTFWDKVWLGLRWEGRASFWLCSGSSDHLMYTRNTFVLLNWTNGLWWPGNSLSSVKLAAPKVLPPSFCTDESTYWVAHCDVSQSSS